MDTPSPTTTEVSLVPARRSRAGASDSDGGGVDEVFSEFKSHAQPEAALGRANVLKVPILVAG